MTVAITVFLAFTECLGSFLAPDLMLLLTADVIFSLKFIGNFVIKS